MSMRTFIFLFALLSCLGALALAPNAEAQAGIEPRREFRAAWVATVSNIDWPSNRNLSTEQQKTELLAILDKAVELNLNAIIFQVRPMCDALYQSRFEPWSEFLTGAVGRAPTPFWDPLQFAVEESHKRGLELHAWFNPYRALHPSARTELPRNHVSKTNPGIVRQYGRYLWLDPTDEQTKNFTFNVILDVVRRYNVDGVHIDDYFYPYRSYADGADFPDHANWEKYRQSGGRLSRDDWRRDHVNDFVRRMYELVKQEDPRVKVGISPFGIWRPNNPPGIQGLDQYATLYADAKLWLNEGWLDYFSPQLYWPIDQTPQAYKRLLAWWVGENKKGRHVWPGNFTSKVTTGADSWPVAEIVNQVEATRVQRGATGNIHFSMIALMQNRRNLSTTLKNGPYAQPALVPASPWLGSKPPQQPRATLRHEGGPGDIVVSWASPPEDDVRLWAVYINNGREWRMQIVPAYRTHQGTLRIPGSERATDVAVSAVDRLGNESIRTLLRVR
jgi:uncharacterized lipoprotein YddW (UPF0748 family)